MLLKISDKRSIIDALNTGNNEKVETVEHNSRMELHLCTLPPVKQQMEIASHLRDRETAADDFLQLIYHLRFRSWGERTRPC